MGAAASKEQMRALWLALLDSLLAYFRDTPAEQRKAGHLAVARSFLLDNGVTADSLAREGFAAVTNELRDKMALPFPAPK